MVSITVSKKKLLDLVGEKEEAVLEALPQVKCNVDKEEDGKLSLEITGDRPDLLSLYGVVRALKGFFGREKGMPKAKYKPSGVKIVVSPEAEKIRPVIVGAVVENVKLDDGEIADLFNTQEKLDLTNGRKRRKVSIGLYDMVKLKPPFHYAAVDGSLAFKPLKADKKMTVKQILSEHETGKEYAHLLQGDKYPALIDSKKEVLSLIPIINGVSSSVTSKTRKMFIDHTGTDFFACNASLNILCQDFADCGFDVKTVHVEHPHKKIVTPDTTPHEMTIKVKDAARQLGFDIDEKQMMDCLARQRIDAKETKGTLACLIPPFRPDFLHSVDLVEEMALGYGYNAIKPQTPSLFTRGSRSDYSLLQEQYRDVMTGAGFTEVMTYVLTSKEKVDRALSEQEIINIKNPVSSDYAALRSSLLPNLLEVLSKNTDTYYPQKIFEIGEVVVKDPSTETKTRTDLHLCALVAHKDASLTEAVSLASMLAKTVILKSTETRQFIPGRAASLTVNSVEFGIAGEIHPQLLENYKIQMPVAGLELTLRTGLH